MNAALPAPGDGSPQALESPLAKPLRLLAGLSWLVSGIPFLAAIGSAANGAPPDPALLLIIPGAGGAATLLTMIESRLA